MRCRSLNRASKGDGSTPRSSSLRSNSRPKIGLTLEWAPALIIPMVQQKTLRSGSLAHATGVSPDTIRHYERVGVLPEAARTQAGYRIYPEAAIERVLVVRRALRVGFSLRELAEVFKVRDKGGTPCRRVYQLAEEKLRSVEENIKVLNRTAKYLKTILCDWEQRMERAGPNQKANLLHSLSEAPKSSEAPLNNFRRKRKV